MPLNGGGLGCRFGLSGLTAIRPLVPTLTDLRQQLSLLVRSPATCWQNWRYTESNLYH